MTSATTSGAGEESVRVEPDNMSTVDCVPQIDSKETFNEELNQEGAATDGSKDTELKYDNSLQTNVEEIENKVGRSQNMASTTTSGGHIKNDERKQVGPEDLSTTDCTYPVDSKKHFKEEITVSSTTNNEEVSNKDASKDTAFRHDDNILQRKVEELEKKVQSKKKTVKRYKEKLKKEKEDKQRWQQLVYIWRSKTDEWLKKIDKFSDTEDNEDPIVTGIGLTTNVQETSTEPQLVILEQCMQTCLDERIKTQKDIQSWKKKNKDLLDRVSPLEDSLETSGKERDNLRKEMNSQRQKITNLSRKLKEAEDALKTTLNERHKLNDNLKNYESENERLSNRQDNQKLKEENQRLKEELKELRLRLSEIAGSLLVNRNPSIADLSDVTRPTKLAEIFSELYDNQWTEAFEEEEGPEQKIIEHLLRILMNIHSSCQKVSSAYLTELEDKISILPGTDTTIFEQTENIPVTTRKFMIEIRRSVSEQIIRALIKHFRYKFIYSKNKCGKEMKETAIYIDKCTELCWFMAIKDPPVILGDIPKEGELVKKELFKCYTRSGQSVDYCVWPPLLLHKDGPVLCKGIVQGK